MNAKQPWQFWLWHGVGSGLYHARFATSRITRHFLRVGRPLVAFRVIDVARRLGDTENACWRRRFQHERLQRRASR